MDKVIDFLNGLIEKVEEWLDRIFDNFEGYSTNYSKWFVYGFILFMVGKFVKLNVKVDTSRK